MFTKPFSLFLFISILFQSNVFAGDTKIRFEENKNQHPSQVKYKAGVGNGTAVFLETNKFTYLKYDPAQLEKIHEASHEKTNCKKEGTVNLHAFEMTFVGANPLTQITASDKADYYYNYFLGNDMSKWGSEVGLFAVVNYKNLYPNIDLSAYSLNGLFKYDFNVAVGADPSLIKLFFNGADKLLIENNRLVIKTSTGDIIENVPYTFQLINGIKTEVKCNYVLSTDGKTVTFQFPNSYNKKFPLVIDPVLIGATYSGAPQSCTTYGHCATYDILGNIYTGGECFNPGYPTSVGAFQSAFGGSVDIAVSKLDPNGSNLLWCTYVGGSSGEIPNSLFVPANGEMYILGASNSMNYPTSVGCFDNSYNGTFDDDIVVTHLNNNGTALIGSTYVGGNMDDGGGWPPWFMNGHDGMRGEIIVDGAGNAWVASFTASPNFPTSVGAYDASLGGAWDGCAFRLSPNCSALQWSSYLGGAADDACYAGRLNTAGEFFVTGCAGNNTFPTTVGVYDPAFNGGALDAYVTRFNAAGSALVASTFIGTPTDEIGYFMDMDAAGNPYIYGSSTGAMPVTVGVYSNPGSGNFVTKFNPGLTALGYSTVFGDGTPNYLEPEAFMVDSCENIYMSGFGSTPGYPVTTNALYPTQASAGGGDCYFICISKNALTLLFGSFYFGWHVDGGTSRFDPSGAIYQGICIGGGGATTPLWAWKNNVNAPSWDMYVVKIDFQQAGVNAIASIAPNDTICAGDSINFLNASNGTNFIWDFGDGSSLDTNSSPTHTYNLPGNYVVTFIAIDSSSCIIADTAYLNIVVLSLPTVFLGNDTTLCGVPNLILNAGTGGNIYLWNTGATTQTILAITAGTYWVDVSNGICSARDSIVIQLLAAFSLGSDTALCAGQPLTLNPAITGASYLWNTGATTQSIIVNTSGQYFVNVSAGTCTVTDTINVVFTPLPTLSLPADTNICPSNPLIINATGTALTYLWNTGATTQSINVAAAGNYYVTASNGNCTITDTVTVNNIPPLVMEDNVALCNIMSYTLDAGIPNASYTWSNGETTQSINITNEGVYWVNINASGCLLSDTTSVTGTLGDGVVYFPNSFTPTGDSHNEYFTGYGTDITYFHLMIFNRWGDMIYETETQYPGWDGKMDGIISQEDVYVWKVEYKTKCSDDRMIKKIGHVAIIK